VSAAPSLAVGPERLSMNAIATLVALTRYARSNGLVSLGIPGRHDHAHDMRTPEMLEGVDELLAARWVSVAPNTVIRSQGELVLDVSGWLKRIA
jgi:hypothetical protein